MQNNLTLSRLQQQFMPDLSAALPPVEAQQHSLNSYDQLLSSNRDDNDTDDNASAKQEGSADSANSPSQQPIPAAARPARLKLTQLLTHWEATESQALQQQWSYAQFLLTLCEQGAGRRNQMRLKRAIKEAQLPAVKSLTSFEFDHCTDFNPAPLMQLADDDSWLDKASNCLIFGPSGVGKPHPG